MMTSFPNLDPTMTSISTQISIHFMRIIAQIEPNIAHSQYDAWVFSVTIDLVAMLVSDPFEM